MYISIRIAFFFLILILKLDLNSCKNNTLIESIDSIIESKNCLKRHCFKELGCFSAQTFIDEVKKTLLSKEKLADSVQTALALKQLLAICPIAPDLMNATFLLFTKSSEQSSRFRYNSPKDQLRRSSFSPRRRTAVIVHGYTDSYKECEGRECSWMATMKNYFLTNDYNVVAIDWSKPANDINYFNSAFNTQIAGAMVAYFIRGLVDVFGAKPETFQLVGHSLGAHLCGFAAKKFNGSQRIGHISGLDPAGPGFSHYRLSREDANLVVVSHTSAGILKDVDENIREHPIESIQLSGFLGLNEPLGHFDFWPNGGNGQPGCEKLTKSFINDIVSNGISGLKDRGGCSHNRATQLPTSRPQNNCQLIGYKCESYDDFNDGKCSECGPNHQDCRPLEFDLKYWINANNWRNSLQSFPNNFYLKTTDRNPFCLFHYQIIITVEESSEAGEIKLKLFGEKRIDVSFKRSVTGFKSNQNYTQLITDSENWGQITEAIIDFDDNVWGKVRGFSKKLNPFRSAKELPIKIKTIGIRFMSHIDPGVRNKFSIQLFPESDNESGNSITFKPKNF